eukprot:TRINITY_DN111127_c0_g1_i1.p1 TRINITY_DN111127_c0_g1~~TRINITY_DN111127_c0_g1_i1.p1  ORF type:complete len:399 (-),score=92.47 TRINITY_DN111127_c0_g1_i1:135-1262(-)
MNQAKAMLDALMGPQRDVGRKGKKDPSDDWKDKSVCKNFLVGCCPKDKDLLGGVQKLDLVACTKIHSELIRNRFLEHADGKKDSKLRQEYEEDMLVDLQDALKERDRFLQREKEKMKKDKRYSILPQEDKEKVDKLKEDSEINLRKAKELEEMAFPQGQGGGNNFYSIILELRATAKEMQEQAEDHQRAALRRVAQSFEPRTCDVCGTGYMNKEEYEAHLSGRVHEGFQQVQEKWEELKQQGGRTKRSPSRKSPSGGRSRARNGRNEDVSRSRGARRKRGRADEDDEQPKKRGRADDDEEPSIPKKRGRADDDDADVRGRQRGGRRDGRREYDDDTDIRNDRSGRFQRDDDRRGRRPAYDDESPPRRPRRHDGYR